MRSLNNNNFLNNFITNLNNFHIDIIFFLSLLRIKKNFNNLNNNDLFNNINSNNNNLNIYNINNNLNNFNFNGLNNQNSILKEIIPLQLEKMTKWLF